MVQKISNDFKLMLAKAIYYVSLTVASLGLAFSVGIVLYWLLSNPLAFRLFAMLLGIFFMIVGFGLAYGWAEKYLEKTAVYRKHDETP